MTPTLSGRWQTRLLLLGTVGFVVTWFFAAYFQAITFEDVFHVPFVLLVYVAVLGLGWDVLYNVMQHSRWDSDWPPIYQFGAGVAEALLLFALIRIGLVIGVPENLPFWMFFVHYGAVWFWTFVMTQGPLRLLFPQWRFRGGQFGRHPATRE
ncbi:MAG: hypothetical protein HKN04_02085 [Rhodothermaceae bacterium]|nr:hypothetical protein [Rhodothermaceae bacterium]